MKASSADALYVDVDDVLSETTRALARLARERFGKVVDFEAMHSFDLRVSIGLSDEEWHVFMAEAHEAAHLSSLEPLEGAREALVRTRAAGWAVHVITGRPPDVREITAAWLERHELPFDAIEMVDKYGRYAGHGTLSREALLARAYPVVVEDSLEIAEALVTAGTRRVLLMDRPWNRRPVRASAAIRRVSSWSEIEVHLESLEGGADGDGEDAGGASHE